uniref:Uncharacterized protein n=1 Tax=Leptosiphonia brodiei TaxID=2608611 RepID=A0A1Z1M9R1_9FLOR|nr:hypothetical protein [Leptosiphonia brodiei]ARW62848.1 hypothetical protein [Leptosiphonia brodiei]
MPFIVKILILGVLLIDFWIIFINLLFIFGFVFMLFVIKFKYVFIV